MTRHWRLKALAYLVGLGLLFFGLHELQADPALRTLHAVDIAAIEGGSTVLQEGEYVEVPDAYLLPPSVVAAGPAGEVRVSAALGTRALQEAARSHPPVRPGLWVQLEPVYPSTEAALAAMRPDRLYQRPHPVRGVVRRLDEAARTQALQGGALQIESALAVHAGTSPPLLDVGRAVALAGCMVWALVGLWAWADGAADRWRSRLARESSDAEVHAGRSPAVLWSLMGGAVLLIGLGMTVQGAADAQAGFPWGALALSASGLLLFGAGLWFSRFAVLLSADAVEKVGHRKRSRLRLDEVVALAVDEPAARRGPGICTYTLHLAGKGRGDGRARKPWRLGSSLFHGGLTQPTVFGAALRNCLVDRLAAAVASRIRAGEWVDFGPVVAGRTGIAKSRKKAEAGEVLPWGEIDSALVDRRGEMRIRRKGKAFSWAVFPAGRVLNRDALIRFMQNGRV